MERLKPAPRFGLVDMSHRTDFATKVRETGLRGESAYSCDGVTMRHPRAVFPWSSWHSRKDLQRIHRHGHGKIRINCAEDQFLLEIDLSRCPVSCSLPAATVLALPGGVRKSEGRGCEDRGEIGAVNNY